MLSVKKYPRPCQSATCGAVSTRPGRAGLPGSTARQVSVHGKPGGVKLASASASPRVFQLG
eukprot:768543-Hanusia_phi.AAC.10